MKVSSLHQTKKKVYLKIFIPSTDPQRVVLKLRSRLIPLILEKFTTGTGIHTYLDCSVDFDLILGLVRY